MLSETSTFVRRPVWLLVIDQLPFDHLISDCCNSDGEQSDSDATTLLYSPFDDLDMRSTFFEQYLIQDVRKSATLQDALGGKEAVSDFCDRLRASGGTIAHVRLRCSMNEVAHEVAQTFDSADSWIFGDDGTVDNSEFLVPLQSTGVESAALSAVCTKSFAQAAFVCVEVQIPSVESRLKIAASIVEWIRRARETVEALDSNAPPVLLVTSLRGEARSVVDPFAAVAEESLVHAPLWIEHGAGHVRRVQSLAGSFDLLPTILEYLSGDREVTQETATTEERSSQVLAHLSGKPLSLARLPQTFHPEKDRLLRLKGDLWNALRSHQYLLVQEQPCDPEEVSESCEVEKSGEEFIDHRQPVRHLFLKPDDVWNVHNVIVAYEAIADEMEALSGGW